MGGFFSGTPESFEQVPTVTPGQQGLLQQLLSLLGGQGGQGGQGGLLSQGLGQLGQGLQEFAPGKSPMEQMAMRQFREQQIPELSEMFAGMNAGSSSGFQQQLGQAAGGLAENMAGMRQQQQQSSLQSLMSLLNPALGTQTFATGMKQRQPGILEQLAPLLGSAVGGATPNLIKGAFGGFN